MTTEPSAATLTTDDDLNGILLSHYQAGGSCGYCLNDWPCPEWAMATDLRAARHAQQQAEAECERLRRLCNWIASAAGDGLGADKQRPDIGDKAREAFAAERDASSADAP